MSARLTTNSFRTLLQEELDRRQRANPCYSLRAFAKSLGMDAASCSKILSGKRIIGTNLTRRLGKKMGLSETQIRFYSPNARGNSLIELDMERFELISEWVHYAILELTELADFQSEVSWIAQRLDITESKTQTAVDRLLRLGLLKRDTAGNLADASGGSSTTTHLPYANDAKKKAQRDILALAMKALENIPYAERSQSSVTISTNSEKLGEVEALIAVFRRQLIEVLNDVPAKDCVYNLSISFYPISFPNRKDLRNETDH